MKANKKILIIGMVILLAMVVVTTVLAGNLVWEHDLYGRVVQADKASDSDKITAYGYAAPFPFPGTITWSNTVYCSGSLGERVLVIRDGYGNLYTVGGCAPMTPTPAP